MEEMFINEVSSTNLEEMTFHSTPEGRKTLQSSIPSDPFTQLGAHFRRLVPKMGHRVTTMVATVAIALAIGRSITIHRHIL
jgi:hypothetical protein